MKDVFTTALSGFLVILFAGLTVSIGNIIHTKCDQIKQSTKNKALRDFIEKFDYVVQVCVEATNQKFVSDYKKTGDFDDAAKDKAFNDTFTAIEALLTEEDKQKIINNFGDVSAFVSNSIENYILQSKKDI